ncbi:hypothetical protein CFOL_v3_00621 [Cephalotus follicularis]|uniref:Uncharacterized protein n=1 Tax=Cephalotus follicularis TaxID=3775 RepID=A0A1Q3ANG5_CEPFO|nr:hypothetical protein CFOL_v3_00621 [Cephalotus follicularis]
MENGHGRELGDKLAELSLNEESSSNNDNNDSSLFQVMKAVEAAEATIKQQVEENNRLRNELQHKIHLLNQFQLDESSVEKGSKANSGADNAGGGGGLSHLSSPSISPTSLMPIPQLNNSHSIRNQDHLVNIREHEGEIMQLRKHLAEYSIKEAQIRNEKYILEKRIAYMRLAFDQQQQELVDAASKALSYRQDIIEENIRLTYALKDAVQERSTFMSSLLPLLAEYSLQPPVPDAQSIVSNVKVLFKHLQEKLIVTETKLKESQYQLAPWRPDANHSNFSPQSPSHSIGAALTTSNKIGLELVPQPAYAHGKIPIASDAKATTDWDLLGHHRDGLGGVGSKNLESNVLGRYSRLTSRNSAPHDIVAQLAFPRVDVHATRYGEETTNKQVTFRDPVSNNDVDDIDVEGHQTEREPLANWGAGNSPYATTINDPSSSYSPYLPPVLEDPSSSFSEAADDDPLPAIEGLQISGEAFPGRELQACGYSINGTTSCNFEWVRHLEDGSVNYIEGAKQPNYLVTADDIDTYLAIEIQPLDDRKRKGELVRVFANEQRKITCDPEMQNFIEKTLYNGHASFRVFSPTGYLDIWEPATLAIKRDAYSIKRTKSNGDVVTEKFSPTTSVAITYGHATEFVIISSDNSQHPLRADNNATDISWIL